MIWVIGLGGWLIGAVATNAAQREIGLRSPLTYDDSFSGDDTVDLICIVAWPIFWPCWVVHKLVERAMRRKDDRAAPVERKNAE